LVIEAQSASWVLRRMPRRVRRLASRQYAPDEFLDRSESRHELCEHRVELVPTVASGKRPTLECLFMRDQPVGGGRSVSQHKGTETSVPLEYRRNGRWHLCNELLTRIWPEFSRRIRSSQRVWRRRRRRNAESLKKTVK
jgi:hypothetical protein